MIVVLFLRIIKYWLYYQLLVILNVVDFGAATSPTVSPTTTKLVLMDTIAGDGTASSTGTGGPANAASFNEPWGVWLDSSDVLYITEVLGNCIRKFPFPNGIVTNVVGVCGVSGYGGDFGLATSALMNVPLGVVVDTLGSVYFTDSNNNRVRKVSNGIITPFAGTGSATSTGDGGPATVASLFKTQGIFIDTLGQVFVSEGSGNRIRKIASGTITLVAGWGATSFTGDGGPATRAGLNSPYVVLVDTLGYVYISDTVNDRVRKINLSGIINTITGTGALSYSGENVPATSASVFHPYGLTYDLSNGDFYYASAAARVQTLSASTNRVTTFAGMGSQYSGEGIPATSCGMVAMHIYLNSKSQLFAADYYAHRVRYIHYNSPTVTPTQLPTCTPTVQPSLLPTILPSRQPTIGPSLTPSFLPSFSPSILPSIIPTILPSRLPTVLPSLTPSVLPSCLPTIQPSRLPTLLPSMVPTTINPSLSPSKLPSCIPTVPPSILPSIQPSKLPSVVPTVQPSRAPSLQPTLPPSTIQPTLLPSLLPTVQPSMLPSMLPSAMPSAQPTVTPTVQPTLLPSLLPTVQPSMLPSMLPSVMPSAQPTVIPTVQPTLLPSLLPTVQPSMLPSMLPSVMPSAQPTVIPTVQLTIALSMEPTLLPSTIQPTLLPSLLPTVQPSMLPSMLPSVMPSAQPTVIPTVQPSIAPSMEPTLSPSTIQPTLQLYPSVIPAVEPSSLPAYPPSCSPTLPPTQHLVNPSVPPPIAQLSLSPTTQPSIMPNSLPSFNPSSMPSTWPSFVPSFIPAIQPVNQPSLVPEVNPSTGLPTFKPTTLPSLNPTLSPTVGPSVLPSVIPTVQPVTGQPSVSSTLNPSDPVSPTLQPSIVPSILLTATQSEQPSCCPTTQPYAVTMPSSSPEPTLKPTLLPSVQFSIQPSFSPTVQPSSNPTTQPTLETAPQAPEDPTTVHPTVLPASVSLTYKPSVQTSAPTSSSLLVTTLPTMKPTFASSLQPTDSPTSSTSVIPTMYPSIKMSTMPNLPPSNAPSQSSTSSAPSLSKSPSYQVSLQPAIEPQPSMQPSMQPSIQPSIQPSMQLSNGTSEPSMKPTIQPLSLFSSQPTVSPSIVDQPSKLPTCPSTSVPSLGPAALPTAQPSLHPSVSPSQKYSVSTSLPSNNSISALIGDVGVDFKVVVPSFPFLPGGTATGDNVFTNVVLAGPAVGTAFALNSSYIRGVDNSINLPRLFAPYAFGSGDWRIRAVSMLPDINGDSYSDLIIGDPMNSKCYVLFGTAAGLVNMTNGFTIFGESNTDLTGWSVSDAGDVNNDTHEDIVIGAPYARGTGAVYVVYGRSVWSDVHLNNFTTSQGFVVSGDHKSDCLGISVSKAGDMNKDDYDDVIVGSIETGNYYTGAAYIVLGSSQMPFHRIKYSGGNYFMFAGFSVSSAGDMNGDGFADVLIGSHPQKVSLTPTTYLVYGSSELSDMVLTALAPPQGIVLLGGGVIVSAIHDGIVVGASVSVSTGSVVVLNTIRESGLISTKRPTYHPSSITSSQPTRKPSRSPTALASARPSRSITPAPTSVNATSFPSAAVQLTGEPSEFPSENPTVEPSEGPTLYPSLIGTVPPSLGPSQKPSTSTRNPYTVPTMAPSFKQTIHVGTTTNVIDGHSGAVYNNSLQSQPIRYIVNGTGSITIDPSLGKCTYVIIPGSNLTLIISRFNVSSDQIDVSRYNDIRQFADLKITHGSVIITLPTRQVVRILNQEPAAMSPVNFIFNSPIVQRSIPVIVIAITVAASGLGIGFLWCIYRKAKKRALIRNCSTQVHTIVLTYVTKDGEYVFTSEDSPEDSLDLSDHTIDSTGALVKVQPSEGRRSFSASVSLSVTKASGRSGVSCPDSFFDISDLTSNSSRNQGDVSLQKVLDIEFLDRNSNSSDRSLPSNDSFYLTNEE